jgi:hypothetical protein
MSEDEDLAGALISILHSESYQCYTRYAQSSSTQTINYSCFAQIIRRHLEFNPISQVQPDKALSHLARNVGEDYLAIGQFDTKHCSGENGDDFTLHCDGRFIGHSK